jgi:hypothetical protein
MNLLFSPFSTAITFVNYQIFIIFFWTIERWNLCNPTPEFSPTSIDIRQKFMVPKYFCYKPEYSNILYNTTHFPGSLVYRIRQVQLISIWFFNFLFELYLYQQQFIYPYSIKFNYIIEYHNHNGLQSYWT